MSAAIEQPTKTVRFELSPKTIVVLAAVGVSLWLLSRLGSVLLVLIVALFLVGTLGPAVQWMEARRVSRGFAVGSVFTALFLATMSIVLLTVPALLAQAGSLVEHEPALRARLAGQLSNSRLSAPLARWLTEFKYDSPALLGGPAAFELSMKGIEIVGLGVLAFFLALYVMLERDRLRGGLFALVPRTRHMRLSRILMGLETIVGAYIRGQAITSLLLAAFTFVLLTSFGIENALALAVLAGVADVLPYIGVILSIVPSVIAAVPHGSGTTIFVLVSLIAYAEFERVVLVPRIYGGALRLPSSVVLVALLTGGTLMGITGALLALPFAAVVFMLVEELRVELPGESGPAEGDLRANDDRSEEEYSRRAEGVPAEQAAAIAIEIAADQRDAGPETPGSPAGLPGTHRALDGSGGEQP
jgi:predicted PurR-regulated permease PerM